MAAISGPVGGTNTLYTWVHSKFQGGSREEGYQAVERVELLEDANHHLFCKVTDLVAANELFTEQVPLEGKTVTEVADAISRNEVYVERDTRKVRFSKIVKSWDLTPLGALPYRVMLLIRGNSLLWQIEDNSHHAQLEYTKFIDPRLCPKETLKKLKEVEGNLDKVESALSLFERAIIRVESFDFVNRLVSLSSTYADELDGALGHSWMVSGPFSIAMKRNGGGYEWEIADRSSGSVVKKDLEKFMLEKPKLSKETSDFFKKFEEEGALALLPVEKLTTILHYTSPLRFDDVNQKVVLEPINKKSQIQNSMKISSFQWTVTLVTVSAKSSGCFSSNHAELLIEGINDGYFSGVGVEPGKPFCYLVHYTEKGIVCEIVNDLSGIRYERRSRVWKRSSDAVKKMLDEISCSETSERQFNRFGAHGICAKDGEDNCWTLLYKMLKIADIFPSRNFHPNNYLFDQFFHFFKIPEKGLNEWRFFDGRKRKIDSAKLKAYLILVRRDFFGSDGRAKIEFRDSYPFVHQFGLSLIDHIHKGEIKACGAVDTQGRWFQVATDYTKGKEFFDKREENEIRTRNLGFSLIDEVI